MRSLADSWYLINQIYEQKTVPFDFTEYNLCEIYENHFFTLHAGDTQSALTVYKNGTLTLLQVPKALFGGIRPMNAMQRYALYALLAPAEEIPLVVLIGPAGTAKTFLAMAAGLSQTYLGQGRRDGQYRKILISKPNSGNREEPGFGYLPGDLDDKMAPLIASYTDTLEAILGGQNGEKEDPARYPARSRTCSNRVSLNFVR